MSYDRREFLKTLTLGGVALFTADWFKLVDETKAASAGKLLPALPGEKVSAKGDQIRAFWNDSEGYFELCLNGTIYDEVPDLEDDDEDEFDDSDLEQGEDESDDEFEERVEAAREEWESENGSSRERRQENHEFDWYRRSCPGAKAVPYLQGLFSELKASSDKVDAGDYADVGSIDFYDGACPGNDTYVAATAPDYATLAALQSALVALDWNCRVVIVEPNPADEAAKA
jgi:hypothetical protein